MKKLITVIMILTVLATYVDMVAHQTDSMNGGRARHTLPTTRAIVEWMNSKR